MRTLLSFAFLTLLFAYTAADDFADFAQGTYASSWWILRNSLLSFSWIGMFAVNVGCSLAHNLIRDLERDLLLYVNAKWRPSAEKIGKHPNEMIAIHWIVSIVIIASDHQTRMVHVMNFQIRGNERALGLGDEVGWSSPRTLFNRVMLINFFILIMKSASRWASRRTAQWSSGELEIKKV